MSESAPVIVVGGGFSGIAVADALLHAGRATVLVERGETLGGRSASVPLGDGRVTMGGKNIGRRYERFREFAARHGASAWEPFGINTTRIDGDFARTLDSGRPLRSYARFARGLAPSDMIRFARMCLAVRWDPQARFLDTDIAPAAASRTLAEHFGPAFCRQVVRPMTVRMNGAEPDEVQLAAFPANLGMLLDTFDQLEDGLQPLFDRFAARLPVRLQAEVERLVCDGNDVVGVSVNFRDGRREELRGSGVVLALPADAAAPLVRPLAPGLAATLHTVRYFPAAVVVAAYDEPVFSVHRRAFLYDAEHPLSNAGAYSAVRRELVRYTFSGRAARPLLGAGADAAALLEIGERLLAPHTPGSPRRALHVAACRWESAYCAYAPDHTAVLRAVRSAPSGLHLTGDYIAGVSIEACFRAAQACAEQALSARSSPKLSITAAHA